MEMKDIAQWAGTEWRDKAVGRAAPVLGLSAAIVLALGTLTYLATRQTASIPPGLAKANGRIEVERIDIAAKHAGRIVELLVKEGDTVAKSAVIARLDTTVLNAQLAAARANVHRASEAIRQAMAEVSLREAEHKLSELELDRAVKLERRQFTSEAELDRRKAQHEVAEARLTATKAAVADGIAAKSAAEAQAEEIAATIAEMTITTPVAGRIEHKLAQAGTIIGPGGRIVSLLDLTDAYMTVFLPTSAAGRVALGSEARIVLDAAPRIVIPATVSFIAAEAQFTPKVVETRNEREKLVYRVKLRLAKDLLAAHADYIKPGLTGEGYVKVQQDITWPKSLAPRLTDAR